MNAQPAPDAAEARKAQVPFQVGLTASFVVRQFVLLGVVATCLLLSLYFFNLYKILDWSVFWDKLGWVDLKWFSLPAIVVIVYGYVLFGGILFALVPSERSFQMFFITIAASLFVSNYDHTTLDWFQRFLVKGLSVGNQNPVDVRKLPLVAGALGAMIYMHYNILADDFTRRMIRRGIPTEEVHRIRPAMLTSLLPLLTLCAGAIVAIGLVGHLSALIFQDHGLIPKLEMVMLGGFGVLIGYILLSIIKELYQEGGNDKEGPNEPAGPG